MNLTDLKPCPFCPLANLDLLVKEVIVTEAETAKVYREHGFQIICTNCNCSGPAAVRRKGETAWAALQEAIEAWNRRNKEVET